MSGAELSVLEFRRIDYEKAWAEQRALQRHLIENEGPDTLMLCEHNPVITIGRSGNRSNVVASTTELEARGVSTFEVERGGDVTYHGPGQLVAYPILDLNRHRRDVGWYMRSLEEVIIRTLQEFEIKGIRFPGRTGVWTQPIENVIDFSGIEPSVLPRKIASIGVRISRWRTLHGISLNVGDCREGFRLINPCGFTDIEVTSIEQELGPRHRVPSVESVAAIFLAHFKSVFGFA